MVTRNLAPLNSFAHLTTPKSVEMKVVMLFWGVLVMLTNLRGLIDFSLEPLDLQPYYMQLGACNFFMY